MQGGLVGREIEIGGEREERIAAIAIAGEQWKHDEIMRERMRYE